MPTDIKFSPGNIYSTPNALRSLTNQDISAALGRHLRGDWGTVCEEDKKANDWSVSNEERLLSSYVSAEGVRFWIITEADRSSTTVLLPEDY